MARGNRFATLVGYQQVLNGLDDLLDDYTGSAAFTVGTDKQYGVYLEFGTSQMRAYPWLGPAISELESKPIRFVQKHAGVSLLTAQSGDAIVERVAVALANRAVDNVSAEGASSRSPGTHPGHPKQITGELADSIEAVEL